MIAIASWHDSYLLSDGKDSDYYSQSKYFCKENVIATMNLTFDGQNATSCQQGSLEEA